MGGGYLWFIVCCCQLIQTEYIPTKMRVQQEGLPKGPFGNICRMPQVKFGILDMSRKKGIRDTVLI